MKKILFVIMFLTTSILSNRSVAQTANLNITLSDVFSFSVTQPASLDVIFDNESKYTNGITSLASDHISVISSKGYTVKAVAGVITGPSSLTAGTVKLSAAVGSTNSGNTSGVTYVSDLTLPDAGSTPATLITATHSSFNGSSSTAKFNVSYLIGAGGVYAGKATGLNIIPVTYAVTQP